MSKRYTAACYRPELPVVPEFSARPLPFHCPLFACTLTPHCEPPLPSRPDRTQQQQTAANSNNNNYNHNNYNHNNHRIGAVFFWFFFFLEKTLLDFIRARCSFVSLIDFFGLVFLIIVIYFFFLCCCCCFFLSRDYFHQLVHFNQVSCWNVLLPPE